MHGSAVKAYSTRNVNARRVAVRSTAWLDDRRRQQIKHSKWTSHFGAHGGAAQTHCDAVSRSATSQIGNRKTANVINWNGQLYAYKSPAVAVEAAVAMRGNSTIAHAASQAAEVATVATC